MQDYEQAIINFREALERNPAAQEPRLWLAAAYGHQGKIENAKWELEQIRLVDPGISIKKIEGVIPLKDPAQLKHFVDWQPEF